MTRRQRTAGLALLGLLGWLAAELFDSHGPRLWAEPRPLPARTTQFTPASEPPLADAPAAPAGPVSTADEDEGSPCPEDPPIPMVRLRVRVPVRGATGQELEYHLCVENCSEAPAHHVLVRNPLPANARFVRAQPEPNVREPELQWQLGTLPACATREIVLVLSPTGTGDVKNCARVQFEHGQCVTTRIAQASPSPGQREPLPNPSPTGPPANPPKVPPAVLKLHKAGPAQAILYDSLTFQLTVTNTGGTPAIEVHLTDTLANGLEHSSGKNQLTWQVGTLAPGESRSVEYQVVAKSVGRLCNRALASAVGGLHDETESCVTVAEVRMTLTKTGPVQRYLNLAAPYRITVTNAGTAPLTNVQIIDAVPAQMVFVSAGQGGRFADNQVLWAIGGLEPGGSRSVDVVLRPRTSGKICNKASATADRGLTAQAEFCTDFEGVSALLTEVVDTEDPVEVGTETSYVIRVRNLGSKPITNLNIVAEVPAQMAVARAKGPSDNRKEERKVIFQPLGLEAQAEARYEVTVKALQPGDVRFKVDVTADQLTSGPVHEEESTTIYRDFPLSPAARPASP